MTAPANTIDEPLRRQTLKLAILEGCAWAVMSGFGDQFIGPFAVFLQAGDFSISLLTTLPLVMGALAQLLGGYLVERMGRRRPLVVWTTGMQAVGFLPLFWIPYLFPSHGAAIAVSISTCMLISVHLGVPAFSSVMGELVPEEQRGRYFGKRTALILLSMLVSMLCAGRVVAFFEHRNLTWQGFGTIFTIAMIARVYSTYLQSRYYEPPFKPSTDNTQTFTVFIQTLTGTNFGRFTITMALMACATNIAAPFYTQYMLRDLHWTKDQFAAATAAFLLTQFIFLRWWGRVCDKHGSLAVIRATSLILPLAPILWALNRDFHVLLGVQILSGIAWSGFNLAALNFLYDSVPAAQRHRTFAYYTVVNGVFILIGGSVVGAWCASNMPANYQFSGIQLVFLSSLPAIFIVSGLLRALAAILLLPKFKEVRKAEPISSSQLLWRLSTGEPILDRITEVIDLLPRSFRSSAAEPERR